MDRMSKLKFTGIHNTTTIIEEKKIAVLLFHDFPTP